MGKKYIIELEDKPFHKGNSDFLYRVKGFNSLVFDMTGVGKLTPYTEPDLEQVIKEAYQKGLSDAWEAARKVVALSTVDRRNVFGSEYMYSILEKHTAAEAIEKIRQYEQENEELGIQGYFKRGDEVIDADGTKAVILRVSEDNYCQVYTKNGCIYNWHIHTYKFHKTGRHFPEIAEVLKKMREE